MGKLIIGLSGKKGSGKDTVCQFLQNKLGHGRRFAFADPIKEIASEYFGIDRKLCDAPNEVKNSSLTDWLWEEIPSNIWDGDERQLALGAEVPVTDNGKIGPMTVREVLQWIGTEIFRNNMHKDFWVKATFNRIKKDDSDWYWIGGTNNSQFTQNKENLYLITDVRFPNEVQAIKDAGGLVVRVTRDSVVSTDPHPSETSLDESDKKMRAADKDLLCAESAGCCGGGSASLWEITSGAPYDFCLQNNLDLTALENVCEYLADCIKGKLTSNENS